MNSDRYVISRKVTEREPLAPEDVRDIELHLPDLPPDQRLLLSLLLYTGMRRGELIGLRWQDVDLSSGLIHIRQSVTFLHNVRPIVKSPKTRAGIRAVPILPELMCCLVPVWRQDGYVLGGKPEPITLSAFLWTWRTIGKTIDLHGATPHILRHTFATMAVPLTDVKTLQAILGHSRSELTMNVYAHNVAYRIADAGAVLGGMYGVKLHRAQGEKSPEPPIHSGFQGSPFSAIVALRDSGERSSLPCQVKPGKQETAETKAMPEVSAVF